MADFNSIEQDTIFRVFQDITRRIKVLESEVLRIRSTFQPIVYEALTTGATDMDFDNHSTVKVTPNSNATYTTGAVPAGNHVTLIILTSGTSSYTITFGSGFKTTGTLATGVTSARVFVVEFVSDGTNLYEVSRTVAMVA